MGDIDISRNAVEDVAWFIKPIHPGIAAQLLTLRAALDRADDERDALGDSFRRASQYLAIETGRAEDAEGRIVLLQADRDAAARMWQAAEERADRAEANTAAAVEAMREDAVAAVKASKPVKASGSASDGTWWQLGVEDTQRMAVAAIRAIPSPAPMTVQQSARAPEVAALVQAIERLNAACDAMWNDHDRLEKNPGSFGQKWQLKEAHMKAISEAQQALPAVLAALDKGAAT